MVDLKQRVELQFEERIAEAPRNAGRSRGRRPTQQREVTIFRQYNEGDRNWNLAVAGVGAVLLI